MAPISSKGWAMVVEVSPWTKATTLGRCSLMASSIWSGVKTVPHSASMGRTSPPERAAISHKRWPKRPKTGTKTRSPGAMRDVRMASIPARAVPLTRNAHWFSV